MKQKPNRARKNRKSKAEQTQEPRPSIPFTVDEWDKTSDEFKNQTIETLERWEHKLTAEDLTNLSNCYGWMSFWLSCRAFSLVKRIGGVDLNAGAKYSAPPQSLLHLN